MRKCLKKSFASSRRTIFSANISYCNLIAIQQNLQTFDSREKPFQRRKIYRLCSLNILSWECVYFSPVGAFLSISLKLLAILCQRHKFPATIYIQNCISCRNEFLKNITPTLSDKKCFIYSYYFLSSPYF